MNTVGLDIRKEGALDFVSVGALVHRLDTGVVPFRKATECLIHVSGGEFNCAANLANCFGLKTGAPGRGAMQARDLVDGHEADIVPVAGIARAGIAEAGEDQHGGTPAGVSVQHRIGPKTGNHFSVRCHSKTAGAGPAVS